MRALLIAVAVASGVLACAPPQNRTIALGVVIDRTGSEAAPSWADAATLAFNDFNQALSSAGASYQFELFLRDSANSGSVALSATRALVDGHAIKGLITDGTESDQATNATNYDADPSQHLNLPIICMACTSAAINNPAAIDSDPLIQAADRNSAHWNFRTTADITEEALVAAKILAARGDANIDGALKISVEGQSDGYPITFIQAFTTALNTLYTTTTPIVDRVLDDPNANVNTYDWDGTMAALEGDENPESPGTIDGFPDALMDVTDPAYNIALLDAYQRSGSSTYYLHTHNFRSILLVQALGNSMVGAEGVSHAVIAGAAGDAFASQLEAFTGIAPQYRDSMTYDASVLMMLAVVKAIHDAHLSDPSLVEGHQVRDALQTINDSGGTHIGPGAADFGRAITAIGNGQAINYDGASGDCDFDANGNVQDQIAHWQVQTGPVFVDIEKYDCPSDLANCPQL